MRIVVQRVKNARVEVDDEIVGAINNGLLVFLAVARDDQVAVIAKMAEKVINSRIFTDAKGKMNLSLLDTGGEVLLVSQFTLLADTKKGNRPSFMASASHEQALLFYKKFVEYIRTKVEKVETGIFAAEMQVSLQNDGPVTIIIDL